MLLRDYIARVGRRANDYISIDERLEAMRRVAGRGYPVRAIIMPITPIGGWQDAHRAFTERLIKTTPIQRLTLGGICIYRSARELMERKMGRNL